LKGKVLNDEKTLRDYQMAKDTTLHLMISKPTGSPAAPSSPLDTTATTSTAADQELSSEAQTALKGDSFWKAIEQTLDGQLGAGDAKLVLDTWKKALSE
jgi:hypothetical protein